MSLCSHTLAVSKLIRVSSDDVTSIRTSTSKTIFNILCCSQDLWVSVLRIYQITSSKKDLILAGICLLDGVGALFLSAGR